MRVLPKWSFSEDSVYLALNDDDEFNTYWRLDSFNEFNLLASRFEHIDHYAIVTFDEHDQMFVSDIMLNGDFVECGKHGDAEDSLLYCMTTILSYYRELD